MIQLDRLTLWVGIAFAQDPHHPIAQLFLAVAVGGLARVLEETLSPRAIA